MAGHRRRDGPAREPPRPVPPATPPSAAARRTGPESRASAAVGPPGAGCCRRERPSWLGAGAGVAAELAPARPAPRRPGAAAGGARRRGRAERALIADLDATTGGARRCAGSSSRPAPTTPRTWRADRRCSRRYRRAEPAAAAGARAAGAPRTRAQLRAAEQGGGGRGAPRRPLTAPARLLASIAACEATHAELLHDAPAPAPATVRPGRRPWRPSTRPCSATRARPALAGADQRLAVALGRPRGAARRHAAAIAAPG